jgi:preprotein translocase subunit SecE
MFDQNIRPEHQTGTSDQNIRPEHQRPADQHWSGGTVTQSRPVRSTGSSGPSRSSRTSPTTFYRQVVAELRKVVWPSQQQLVTYFLVVLVFVIVVMTIVSLLDLGFGRLVFKVFG